MAKPNTNLGYFYSENTMPTISQFYGIIIQMFWNEHAPPHFHATYGDYKATINIKELSIMEGSLPRRAHRFGIGLGRTASSRIARGLDLCLSNNQPKPIEPLK
jgi:hypothetical protein